MKPTALQGLELCRAFFAECGRPLLAAHFPGLPYAAALLGYGSDVLGYDDATSRDHMWGPRFYLFLREEDIAAAPQLMEVFRQNLPVEFMGFSVNFSAPDPADGGVRVPEPVDCSPVNPLIFIHTPGGYIEGYLGKYPPDTYDEADWLCFDEQRLLALTSGEVFHDGIGLARLRGQLAFYPDTVWRYLLASQWANLAQEQAFIQRTAQTGDELGSRILAARTAERLMRLALLYRRQYAPYSKWFGRAFSELCLGNHLPELLEEALAAPDGDARQEALVLAQLTVGKMHNDSALTEPLPLSIEPYFSRSSIRVIYADRFAYALQATLAGTALEGIPLLGTMSQLHLTNLLASEQYIGRLRPLYTQPKTP